MPRHSPNDVIGSAPKPRRSEFVKTRQYVIRGGADGRERLRLLSEVMDASTRRLLEAVGIPPGAACLDVGCGGGDVTRVLARATGPEGSVTGIDLDETELTLARSEAEQMGLGNIRFEVGDVTEWQAGRSFDVVYTRFLLTHLPDPRRLLASLRRHIRPGGVIIIEDIDFRGHFAEPECAALRRYVELYTASVLARGADPYIGPKLPEMLYTAGFDDIQLMTFQPVALLGGIKDLTCITLEYIAETVVGDHLIGKTELSQLIAELRSYSNDPHTVLGGPRVFQAWGRNA